MQRASRALVILAAAATLGLMAFAASFTWRGLPFLLAMAAWAVSPWGVLWLMARRRDAKPPWHAATLLAVLACAFLGSWAYVQGFVVKPDAQSGLLFLFVPLWQWVAVATGLVAGAILASRSASRPAS